MPSMLSPYTAFHVSSASIRGIHLAKLELSYLGGLGKITEQRRRPDYYTDAMKKCVLGNRCVLIVMLHEGTWCFLLELTAASSPTS